MNNNTYMMKTATQTRRTYEVPDTSVDVIEMERDFLQGTLNTGQMQDMNWNGLDDDDDFNVDY